MELKNIRRAGNNNPACFSCQYGIDPKSTKVKQFDMHGFEGTTLSSSSILKGVQRISRLFIRVEARPGSVASLTLKDVRLVK